MNLYHKTGIFIFILGCVAGVFVFLNFDKIVAAPILVRSSESGTITTNVSQAGSDNLTSGLVGYWTFDGQQMYNNVADSSGQGNTGYLSGQTSTTTVPGVVGQALEFDGVDDYTTASGFTDLGTADKEYSFSFWFKTSSVATDMNIIHISSLSTGGGWCISPVTIVSSKIRGLSYAGGVVTVDSTTTIATDTWYHAVNTWDSSGLKIYVDGVLENTTSQATYSASGASNYVWLARYQSGCEGNRGWFDGLIDETRIYNRELSQSEITELYNQGAKKLLKTNVSQAGSDNLANGLIGHWTFDGQQMYNNVADSSGNANHGSLVGQTSTTTVPGVVGQALYFDGDDDYVDLGTGALGYTDLSISFWIKYVDDGVCNSNYEGIVSKESYFDFVVGVDCTGVNIGKIVAYFVNTLGVNSDNLYSTTSIDDDSWHHVAVASDGTNVRIYVDGAFENSVALSGDIDDDNALTTIGKYSDTSTQEVTGSIDEVRIYSRTLSASEVAELYNQGRR